MHRSRGAALLAVGLLAVGGCHERQAGAVERSACSAAAPRVCFSPDGGCTERLVHAIEGAQRRIRVQAYSFTSVAIARALVQAARRGVDVAVVVDKSNRRERYSVIDFLAHTGVTVRIDELHAIAHDKVVLLDDDGVWTGSFNFTQAAERDNAENLLEVHNRALASAYLSHWNEHAAHAAAYGGRR